MDDAIKILIVDDEQIIRERIKKLLELDDYQAFIAENGVQGLEVFDREQPDIVLSDIKMPVMDGIEFLREVKERRKDTEVIMITGHGGVDTAIQALREGAFSYITKPVDYDELELDIKKALDKIATKRKLDEAYSELKEAHRKLQEEMAERQRAESARKQMMVQAMAQEKLASLGELATGVAHEINQPLTYINTVLYTSLEKCRKNTLAPEKLAVKLEKCIHQSERITSIITQLRTFGRAEDLTMQPVHLPGLLDDTLILLSERLRLHNIILLRDIADELPMVIGNANKLEQVFINFFQNAVDALEEKKGGEIRVVMDQDHDRVRVCFSDNGSGMPPQVRDKIFEPFFTTKGVGKGTGLGLAITYGIIQEHKGEITCDSEPGKGTTLTVSLPIR